VFSAARAGANLPAACLPPPLSGLRTWWPTYPHEDKVGAPPAVVGQAPARTFDPPLSHRCRSSFLSFAYKDTDWYSISMHLTTHSVGGSLLHQSPSQPLCPPFVNRSPFARQVADPFPAPLLYFPQFVDVLGNRSLPLQKWCSVHMSFTPNHIYVLQKSDQGMLNLPSF
jgi:hypothetical protein